MTKLEFLYRLQTALSGLPKSEIDSRIAFYSEMIDDRIEEGCSEEEAVHGIGSVETIRSQILNETPLSAKEMIAPKKRLSGWQLLLLVLGAPLWIALLISILAVIFSVYVSLWAVIISLWSVFGACIACGICFLIAGIYFAFTHSLPGFALLGVGLLCVGFGTLLFFGCRAATLGTAALTKKLFRRCFSKKEVA